jgi:hypothetical protein
MLVGTNKIPNIAYGDDCMYTDENASVVQYVNLKEGLLFFILRTGEQCLLQKKQLFMSKTKKTMIVDVAYANSLMRIVG